MSLLLTAGGVLFLTLVGGAVGIVIGTLMLVMSVAIWGSEMKAAIDIGRNERKR